MTLPLLMGSMGSMPLACPPDDVLAWLCFLLGFGLATFVLLIIAHISRR